LFAHRLSLSHYPAPSSIYTLSLHDALPIYFFATLLFSQGTPMIVAGDEFARTQHGNNNAYCQDSEIGWIDWNISEESQELLSFVRKLVRLRQRFPMLRRNRFLVGAYNEELGVKDVTWLAPNAEE